MDTIEMDQTREKLNLSQKLKRYILGHKQYYAYRELNKLDEEAKQIEDKNLCFTLRWHRRLASGRSFLAWQLSGIQTWVCSGLVWGSAFGWSTVQAVMVAKAASVGAKLAALSANAKTLIASAVAGLTSIN